MCVCQALCGSFSLTFLHSHITINAKRAIDPFGTCEFERQPTSEVKHFQSSLTRIVSVSTRSSMFEEYRPILWTLIGLGKISSRLCLSRVIHLGILFRFYNRYWVNRSFFASRHSMQGKTVLITGGADGIGYETAKDLLGRGFGEAVLSRKLSPSPI